MAAFDIKDIWYFANNIIRSSRQLINVKLNPLDLSSAEGNILLHLFTQDHEVKQEDIVGLLDISKPAVSRAMKSLERKGYIKKHRDFNDRRASKILLTDKALEIKPDIEHIYNEVYSIAARGVSDEEVAFFVKLFARVSDNFSRLRSTGKTGGGDNDA